MLSQNVPEQGGGHAEGDQRGPAALQIQQLRRGVFGEQLGQRAEGLAVRWVAATAVVARARKGDIAEHGAKDDRVLSFTAQVTTAGWTTAVPIDEGRSLGGDDMLLQALLQGFTVADRQAKGFKLVVTLLEMQDLAVGEHGAIVADDPATLATGRALLPSRSTGWIAPASPGAREQTLRQASSNPTQSSQSYISGL